MFDNSSKKGCMTVVIVVLGIFLTIGIILVVQTGNYLAKSRVSQVNHYCNEAQIPACSSCVDRLAIIDYRTGSMKCLESGKGKDAQALINQLPYGFSDAVTYALTKGKTETAKDLDGKLVTRYYIPDKEMPLDGTRGISNRETYYCVLEYPDGSCRFAIILDVNMTVG